MNYEKAKVIEIIYASMRKLNNQLPEESKLIEDLNTILVGEGGVLDSLGIITLLVNIEEAIFEKKHLTVVLLDELTAIPIGEHPFHSVNALADWIMKVQSSNRKID